MSSSSKNRFNFEWSPSSVDPTLINLSEYELPFIPKEDIPNLDDCCKVCIYEHINKYQNHLDEDNRPVGNRFLIKCRGILKDPLPPEVHLQLKDSPKTLREAKGIYDISVWAEDYAIMPDGRPWVPRWYQASMLKCSAIRRVARLGRRCLAGDTPILMADGSWSKISDIRIGDHVLCRNTNKGKADPVVMPVTDKVSNGIQDVYKITLTNSRELEVTANHPLLTKAMTADGVHTQLQWLSIEQGLKVGHRVLVLKSYEKFGSEDHSDQGKLLGYLLSDGYLVGNGQTPKFTNTNPLYIQEVQDTCYKLFGYQCSIREKGNGWDLYLTNGDKGFQNLCFEWLTGLGLDGKKSKAKDLLSCIKDWNKESVALLINRLFSGDGTASVWKSKGRNGSGELSLSYGNKTIPEQIRLILLKFGINGIVKEEKANEWKLRISDAYSIKTFFEQVGLIYGKEDKCKELQEAIATRSRAYLRGWKYFSGIKIRNIEYVGQKEVFDICVHKHHNFIANGIVSHNSGKSDALAVYSIFVCLTKPFLARDPDTGKVLLGEDGKPYPQPTRVLAITPRQSHADNLMGKVTDFLEKNPVLRHSVKESKKSPYYVVEFYNGSKITCITTGAGTASSGLGARSFDADVLLLDEANYLEEADLEAARPILATNQNCILWAVSTPKGMQDFFWNWCFTSPSYKEFHYPTAVVPHWNQIRTQVMADCQTEDEFLHEWMAEFSAPTEGVFRPDLIREAAKNYAYDALAPDPAAFIYSIGVDWNSTAGTEIMVVGFNQYTDMHMAVEAVNIPKARWTQLTAIEALLSLARKWRPQFIYVDAGYGHVQIELMQLHSEKARMVDFNSFDAKIGQILVPYDFGSKIVIRNPVTYKKEKKNAKVFLVENAVRRFEEKRISFPAEDTLLHSQLNHYIVSNISPTGVPIYKPSKPTVGDHRLDALMLALVGFQLKLSPFAEMQGGVLDLGYIEVDRLTGQVNRYPAGEKHSPFGNDDGWPDLPSSSKEPHRSNHPVRPKRDLPDGPKEWVYRIPGSHTLGGADVPFEQRKGSPAKKKALPAGKSRSF